MVQRQPEPSSLTSEKETWIKSQLPLLIKLPSLSGMDLKDEGLNSSYNGNISELIWQNKQKEVINKSRWNYIVVFREWLRKGHKDYKNQLITEDCFYIKKSMSFSLPKRKKEKGKQLRLTLHQNGGLPLSSGQWEIWQAIKRPCEHSMSPSQFFCLKNVKWSCSLP